MHYNLRSKEHIRHTFSSVSFTNKDEGSTHHCMKASMFSYLEIGKHYSATSEYILF